MTSRRGADQQPPVEPVDPVEPVEPVVPARSADDADVGWGDYPEPGRDDDWYERERPPHWG